MMSRSKNKHQEPPLKIAAVLFLIVSLVIVTLVYCQFRGIFIRQTTVMMESSRAGLVMIPGSPVTFNGVQIGQVDQITPIQRNGQPAAHFTLKIRPKYLDIIPENVHAEILATTLFGNKYVSLTSPRNPANKHIDITKTIHVQEVTTEFNTLFQTVTALSEKIDPIKLNLTLSAAAQALQGLGNKLGRSLVDANAVLDEVNPRMPIMAQNIRHLADLTEIYSRSAPQLLDILENTATTAHTLSGQQKQLDNILITATGLGDTGADLLDRSGPYLTRTIADLVPVTGLLDTYSPSLYCGIRGGAQAAEISSSSLGGNGYSLSNVSKLIGAANPYIFPENLPRVNAHGGPGGAPGCWQEITRDFWPAPYLVADTGVSIAPYNHFEIGSPWAVEYVWGRQVGDNTINP